MDLNTLPAYDTSVNTTGCCPRFNPEGWDAQDLHLKDKRFVHATTRSAMHIPINMGSVFDRVQRHIEEAGAFNADDYIVLTDSASPWRDEHYFAVAGPVDDEKTVTLSGDFMTKVFEGPYQKIPEWDKELQELVRAEGKEPGRVFFFYTTCPKCSKAYGENYVVGVAET